MRGDLNARDPGESQTVAGQEREPAKSPAYRIDSDYSLRMMLVVRD